MDNERRQRLNDLIEVSSHFGEKMTIAIYADDDDSCATRLENIEEMNFFIQVLQDCAIELGWTVVEAGKIER